MYITIADKPVPQAAVFADGNQRDEATLVGASMRGWVYQSAQRRSWYRLIPMEDTTIDWRHKVRAPVSSNNAAVLASTLVWQQSFDDLPCLVVAYQAPGESWSLAEQMRDSTATTRLHCALAALRAVEGYWKSFPAPLFPMPADFVIDTDGQAQLLWIPQGDLPDERSVFAAPHRVLYLAPELLRSAANIAWDATSWEAVDRYALGVMLLGCYCKIPSVDSPETAIFRAASGSLVRKSQPLPDLPDWLEKFSNYRTTVGFVQRLTSPAGSVRLDVDLQQLADRVEKSVDYCDPRTAIVALRDLGRPLEALELVQEVLPRIEALGIGVESQYDLLCQAGELCGGFLHRPLEALDYYERAITLRAELQHAYREQLRIIANARHHSALESIVLGNPAVASDLDVSLWRNYRMRNGSRTTHSDDEESETEDRLIARYLLWRRQFDVARDFIYPRLFDAQQTYIWWDFELNICYGLAFVGLAAGDPTNLDRATEQVKQIKTGLEYARQNVSLDPSLLQQYGEELAELEFTILNVRSNGSLPTS